jgi:uncharacterized damage-inducible protein DinB
MKNLLELLEFNAWATHRTLDAVHALSSEQLHRDLGSSFPSVFATLLHTYGADRAWLGRLEGQTPTRPNPEDYASLEALQTAWESPLERWPVVVAALEDPQKVIAYHSYDGDPFSSTLEEIVRHVVNHGTYHRGQVTTMLRQLGAEAVSSDMILFFRSR